MRTRSTGRALLCFLGAALAAAVAVSRWADGGLQTHEYGPLALSSVGALLLLWAGLRALPSSAH